MPNSFEILARRLDEKQTGSKAFGKFAELGDTGLKSDWGWINEEYLTKLSGSKAIAVYTEMRDTAIVAAILNAIEMLARQAKFRIDPASNKKKDIAAALFVESNFNDMSMSWQDTLSEILSMLWAGWSFHEIVYKQRNGFDNQPGMSSEFDDGKIGWRKLPIRSQDSLFRWEMDAAGGVQGMHQLSPTSFSINFIPIQKALLFRPASYKNNPQGRSLLRSAYREWWFVKRIQEIEGIGVERDLAGLPVLRLPAEVLQDSAKFDAWKQLLVDVRRNDQEGIAIPSDTWEDTSEPMYQFELMNSGGERQFNTSEIIDRYDLRIAQSLLADFIHLGSTSAGSKGLGRAKMSMFTTAMKGWLDDIADTFNRHAIPRLMRLNESEASNPRMVFEDVDLWPIDDLAEGIQKLANAGMPLFPNPRLENVLLDLMGLPKMSEDEIQERITEDEETKDERARAA